MQEFKKNKCKNHYISYLVIFSDIFFTMIITLYKAQEILEIMGYRIRGTDTF